MRSLSDTVARLAAMRAMKFPGTVDAEADVLDTLSSFGSNPGALHARVYYPPHLPENAPLVVVLHGCTQTAAGYDRGSGWTQLADMEGFALLFPEQQRSNNPNLCFNWFEPGDIRRDAGEALSIRQMIGAVQKRVSIDPKRIFVTGLSAGGAMAAVMLATYPELFAGGAIIAGLPFGCAGTIPEAFDRMRGHAMPSPETLERLLRQASRHDGPWPRVSVWHGSSDRTVDRQNMEASIAQWRSVHGLAMAPTLSDSVAGFPRRVWRDVNGRDVLEALTITGMGHGTPLDTGPDGVGIAAPYMLDVGISSTIHIARFWYLVGPEIQASHYQHRNPSPERPVARKIAPAQQPTVIEMASASANTARRAAESRSSDIQQTIEKALRSAGLMR